MSGSQTGIKAALQRLQAEKKYFSIAVYRIEGEYAIRIASEGETCGQCDKVHLSAGNIGRVARSGVTRAIEDVSKDASHRSCFSQVTAETVVPIVISGRTIGVIDAESGSGPIDRTDLEDFAREIEQPARANTGQEICATGIYTHQAAVVPSVIMMSFRKCAPLVSPSSGDISVSSCSIDST